MRCQSGSQAVTNPYLNPHFQHLSFIHSFYFSCSSTYFIMPRATTAPIRSVRQHAHVDKHPDMHDTSMTSTPKGMSCEHCQESTFADYWGYDSTITDAYHQQAEENAVVTDDASWSHQCRVCKSESLSNVSVKSQGALSQSPATGEVLIKSICCGTDGQKADTKMPPTNGETLSPYARLAYVGAISLLVLSVWMKYY